MLKKIVPRAWVPLFLVGLVYVWHGFNIGVSVGDIFFFLSPEAREALMSDSAFYLLNAALLFWAAFSLRRQTQQVELVTKSYDKATQNAFKEIDLVNARIDKCVAGVDTFKIDYETRLTQDRQTLVFAAQEHMLSPEGQLSYKLKVVEQNRQEVINLLGDARKIIDSNTAEIESLKSELRALQSQLGTGPKTLP